jgi:hypothetical protein
MSHSIFGDILTYAGLLLSNWASWLTGGIVAALFALWERYRNKPYGLRTVAVFVAFSFIFASYQTWHDEYAQNHSRSKVRESHVAKLQTFYSKVGDLLAEPLAKDSSKADVDKYLAKADAWIDDSAQWIKLNMGDAARDRFLDLSGMSAVRYQKAVDEAHNQALMNLTRLRQNLDELIRNPAWDHISLQPANRHVAHVVGPGDTVNFCPTSLPG